MISYIGFEGSFGMKIHRRLLFLLLMPCLSLVAQEEDQIARTVRVSKAIRELKDADTATRIRALRDLAQLGAKDEGEKVVALLKDGEALVRVEALETLGQFEDPAWTESAAGLLADADAGVRAKACVAIWKMNRNMNPRGVARRVAALMKDPDISVRCRAIDCLGWLKAREYIPELRRLRDGDENLLIQMSAASALGAMGDEGDDNATKAEACKRAFGSADPEVRGQALWEVSVYYLYACADDAERLLLNDPDAEVRLRAVVALEAVCRGSLAAFVKGLKDSDGSVRARCAKVFAGFPSEGRKYIKEIGALLADNDARPRAASVSTLGTLDAKEYADAIGVLLDDADPSVRAAAATATGSLNARGHLKALTKLLSDRAGAVRDAARASLRRLNAPLTAEELYAVVKPAVVRIESKFENADGAFRSVGTGFFVEPQGVIVTNRHVLYGEEESTVTQVTITLSDNRTFNARRPFYVHKKHDLAAFRIDSDASERFPVLDFNFPDEFHRPKVGTEVVAVGHPLDLKWSLSTGKVSQVRTEGRIGDDDLEVWIQTDAAINRGNSGGPLMDLYGTVLGVLTIKLAGEAVEGLAFALSTESFFDWAARVEWWSKLWAGEYHQRPGTLAQGGIWTGGWRPRASAAR